MSVVSVPPQLRCLPDPQALYRSVAQAFAACAAAAIAARGHFRVALAGGETPRPLYERLAAPPYAAALGWPRIEVFFGDERCVAPDTARSNYRMARESLFDAVPLPTTNIHRMRGEDLPARAARRYASELRAAFGRDAVPRFDLILLGLGTNGHTASLFPGGACLRERRRLVCAQYVEAEREWRLTLTLPVLNAARAVWALVRGAGKAQIVARVLQGPRQPEVLPMQFVAPREGEYVWWLDAAAATALGRS